MKLTKIRITNYRGLATLETSVPPAGLIAKGGNARGKSSLLKAVRSVLESRDIGADAIKIGADRAELLIDLDNVSVKRAITPKTSTLTVEKDGMRASKPTTYLKEMLGSSSLDPLELYLCKPKERRSMILAALPCKVTIEQLRKYAPEIPDSFDVSGHGLEAIERARAHYYAERTEANREADDAKRNAERLAAEATKLATAVPPGPVVPSDQAKANVSAAERDLQTLENRAAEAQRAEERTASQRARVEELRKQAQAADASASAEEDTAGLTDLVEAAQDAVRVLEEQLTESRRALLSLESKLAVAKDQNVRRAHAISRAGDLNAQADNLAAALDSATVKAPSAEELQAAAANLGDARATQDRAEQQARALAAVEESERAKRLADELSDEASDLDSTVKRLTNNAPSELLAATDGIPGLSLDGDEVLLEGVRLDSLSGAEQLKFAVEIARRANAKTRILVVDGLERLDTEQLSAFVAHATRDDWQLLGSMVTGGELQLVAIEPDRTAAAAE